MSPTLVAWTLCRLYKMCIRDRSSPFFIGLNLLCLFWNRISAVIFACCRSSASFLPRSLTTAYRFFDALVPFSGSRGGTCRKHILWRRRFNFQGTQRESPQQVGSEKACFLTPSLINWENFFDLYEGTLKISLKSSLLTNWEIFSDLNEKTFENFSANPSTT